MLKNAPTVDEAIDSIAELEQSAENDVSPQQRWIEGVTRSIGRPRSIFFIAAFVVIWIGANGFLVLTHRHAFDPPPFSELFGLLSLAALLMAVLILTAENRLSQIEARRDKLDLRINLLTERKVAKLIDMLDSLRRDLPSIPTHDDPEVHQLREHVDPHDVVHAMETRTEKHTTIRTP